MHAPDQRRVALVNTTIHVPHCLEKYLENAERHGHIDRVVLIVVGDRKTPIATGDYLAGLTQRYSTKITYLDIVAQQKLMRRWPQLDLTIRYDCIQRRNIGYLQAAIDGSDIIISIDDDNYVTDEDYVGHHLLVGQEARVPVVNHPSGWWNVCQRLVSSPPRRFYHRGYPKSRRIGGRTDTLSRCRRFVPSSMPGSG